jgi:hypothetical protein
MHTVSHEHKSCSVCWRTPARTQIVRESAACRGRFQKIGCFNPAIPVTLGEQFQLS